MPTKWSMHAGMATISFRLFDKKSVLCVPQGAFRVLFAARGRERNSAAVQTALRRLTYVHWTTRGKEREGSHGNRRPLT